MWRKNAIKKCLIIPLDKIIEGDGVQIAILSLKRMKRGNILSWNLEGEIRRYIDIFEGLLCERKMRLRITGENRNERK